MDTGDRVAVLFTPPSGAMILAPTTGGNAGGGDSLWTYDGLTLQPATTPLEHFVVASVTDVELSVADGSGDNTDLHMFAATVEIVAVSGTRTGILDLDQSPSLAATDSDTGTTAELNVDAVGTFSLTADDGTDAYGVTAGSTTVTVSVTNAGDSIDGSLQISDDLGGGIGVLLLAESATGSAQVGLASAGSFSLTADDGTYTYAINTPIAGEIELTTSDGGGNGASVDVVTDSGGGSGTVSIGADGTTSSEVSLRAGAGGVETHLNLIGGTAGSFALAADDGTYEHSLVANTGSVVVTASDGTSSSTMTADFGEWRAVFDDGAGETAAAEIGTALGAAQISLWVDNPVSGSFHNLTQYQQFFRANGDSCLVMGGSGSGQPTLDFYNSFVTLRESANTPTTPSANTAVLWCRDNGGGKTQLVAQFPTGAVQVIATEP